MPFEKTFTDSAYHNPSAQTADYWYRTKINLVDVMDEKYALRWLDLVVTTILDPVKTNISAIGSQELESFGSLMRQEITQNKTILSEAAFRIFSKRKIQRMVGQYHRSLFLLLETAVEHHPQITATSEKAKSLGKTAIEAINELLDFIEHRFGEYIDLDSWVPSAHLTIVRESATERISRIWPWLEMTCSDTPLAAMLSEALSLLTQPSPKVKRATFRQVFYLKELIEQLEKLASSQTTGEAGRKQLVNALVFLNFNSRGFIEYYTSVICSGIEMLQDAAQKRYALLRACKEFNQLHYQSELSLHPVQPDVKTAIGRWFDAELHFIEKQRQWDLPLPATSTPALGSEQIKVLCFLSIDQMALLLRALDSLRIIQARSLNSVFQHIAPYLSTARKKDISWESMRTKAYQFEESDRQQVLRVLEKVRVWISEDQPHG